jgi:LPXTG-motif cell wall-anchored protein
VAARFEIHPGCSDYKVGLATYESNTSTFGKNTRETLYRSDVGKFNPGQKHQLGPIKNAPCKFQVDLFRGEVLSYITPDHRYGRGRLLAWDIGGAACKEQEHGGGGEKPKPHAQPSKPTHAGGGAKAPRVKAAKAKRKHVRVRAERAQLPRTGSATGAMALTGFAATLVGGSLVVSAYWRRREQEDSF